MAGRPDPLVVPLGSVLGPFRLGALLGSGVVGTVWQAEVGSSLVALKVVPVARPGRRAALLTEVRAASRLAHGGIVRILDLGETRIPQVGPVAWIASELCAGTVASLVGTFCWPDVRSLLLQVLSALAHAHARGVVHRDLKPENLMYLRGDGERTYRLGDFGIADLGRDDRDGMPTASVGTPLYMAPEQALRRWSDHGPWTDLYALGCMIHELVGGSHPLAALALPGIVEAQARGGMPELTPTFDVPDGLGAITARLLRPEVVRRFRRAADVLAALEALEATVARSPTSSPRPADPGGLGLALVPLRRPRLVGRDAELAQVRAALDGPGLRIVVVTGAEGSGTGALARAVCEEGHELGTTSSLEATWSERGGPQDGLAAMIERDLRSADLDAGQLLALLRRSLDPQDASEVAALLRPEAELGVRLGRASERFGAVRRYLVARAAERPLVMWLDGLEHGIEGQELLRWLGTAPLELRVLVTTSAPELLPAATRVTLGPLSQGHLEELLGSLLVLSPTAAARLADHASGSPEFAVALLEDQAARGGLSHGTVGFELVGDPRGSADLRAAWRSRVVAVQGEADPRPLEVLALLGARVSRAQWRAACARLVASPAEVVEERAIRAGLLTREGPELAFTHGIVREVLREAASEAGRLPALAEACAAEVDEKRDPLRRARLLTLGLDRAPALRALRRAAILLGQQGRTRESIGVLDEHDALAPDPRSEAEAQVIRARICIALGAGSAAEVAAEQALAAASAGGWDEVRADALCARASLHRIRGERPLAALAAEEARVLFERLGDRVGVARALALASDAEPDEARSGALARAALEAFGSAADGSALHAGLLVRVANGVRGANGPLEEQRRLYGRARDVYAELGDRATLAQLTSVIGSVLLDQGEPEGARASMEEALALAARVDEPRAIAVVECAASEFFLHTGDLSRADLLAQAAADRLFRSGTRIASPPETLLAAVRVTAGRKGEARALLDRARRQTPTPTSATAAMMAAVELVLTDDPETFDALSARLATSGPQSRTVRHLLGLARDPRSPMPSRPLRTFDG